MSGDREQYAQRRQEIFEAVTAQAGPTTMPSEAIRVFAMRPWETAPLQRLLADAQQRAAEGDRWSDAYLPGAALFRLGRFAEGLAAFERALAIVTEPEHKSVIRLWMALAQHQLQHPNSARQQFAEAVRLMELWAPRPGEGIDERFLTEVAECVVLREEATNQIGVVTSLLDAPTLLEPEENAVLDNGRIDRFDFLKWTFRWAAVDEASSYELVVEHSGHAYVDIRLRQPGFVYTRLLPFTGAVLNGWTWKVRAIVSGVPTAWSPARPFRLEPINTDAPRDRKEVLLEEVKLMEEMLAQVLNDVEFQKALSVAYASLGNVYRTSQDREPAKAAFRKAIARARAPCSS